MPKAELRFAVGDLVYLRSGGALMVVTEDVTDGVSEDIKGEKILCQWHDREFMPHSGRYPAKALRRARNQDARDAESERVTSD